MIRLGLALAAALFLFVCWMAPARGDGLPDIAPGQAICEENGVRCLVRREDVQKQNAMLEEASKNLRAQEEEIGRLEVELKKLRAIKGCAKLEVIPKPPPPGSVRS
jgi:hypothetical protein